MGSALGEEGGEFIRTIQVAQGMFAPDMVTMESYVVQYRFAEMLFCLMVCGLSLLQALGRHAVGLPTLPICWVGQV